MSGELEERFDKKIKDTGLDTFKLSDFKNKLTLAIKVGMFIGYNMACDDIIYDADKPQTRIKERNKMSDSQEDQREKDKLRLRNIRIMQKEIFLELERRGMFPEKITKKGIEEPE